MDNRNPLSVLTDFAVQVFQAQDAGAQSLTTLMAPWAGIAGPSDPVLGQAARIATGVLGQTPSNAAVEVLTRDPDLAPLRPADGRPDPMVLVPGVGGQRVPPGGLIEGVIASAQLRMYLLQESHDETTFVRLVIEGFQELKRAVRGELTRIYDIHGLSRLLIPDGEMLTTPWGVVRPAPLAGQASGSYVMGRPVANCVLACPRLVRVELDHSDQPAFGMLDATEAATLARPTQLLPLACALAAPEQRLAPVVVWSMRLVPFWPNWGYSWPWAILDLPSESRADEATLRSIEEWCRTVDREHHSSVDTAARRVVTAISSRADRADALIDAVMAWENLVGTSEETTFRVTAALAKLIEERPEYRREKQRALRDVYRIRSQVVHGATPESQRVTEAAEEAITVALEALRRSYRLGTEWLALSSIERADRLLLEQP
jgi:hypothetical protein